MDENERQRVSREAARWSLLRGSPPQSVEVKESFTMPTRRDRVGLPEVYVDFGRFRESLILDTGANLSAISFSLAQRLGLKLSNASATSNGIAGRRMTIRTAVIPEVRIGEAKLRNVAVIVINDRDMIVPTLHYRIPGSIGFPVFRRWGESRSSPMADSVLGSNPAVELRVAKRIFSCRD